MPDDISLKYFPFEELQWDFDENDSLEPYEFGFFVHPRDVGIAETMANLTRIFIEECLPEKHIMKLEGGGHPENHPDHYDYKKPRRPFIKVRFNDG